MAQGKKKKPISKVGDLIYKLVGEIEKSQTFTQDEVELGWNQVAGDRAKKHSHPTSLQKGVLRIAVDNSCWIQELTIQKRKLLKKLQTRFGKDKINDIRFKIACFPNGQKEKK